MRTGPQRACARHRCDGCETIAIVGGWRDRVVAATTGRDRVVDAVKAVALLLVIVGHSLAWTTASDGTVANTLESVPQAFPLTWVLQLLPLFFVLAGQGLVRLGRRPTGDEAARRIVRLVAPALPLMVVTMVLSVIVDVVAEPDIAEAAGLLPVQLVWFLGIYLVVVALAPLLVRVRRVVAFAGWLAAIAVIDVLRVNVSATIGWVNLVLVWALFASLGTQLERIRNLPRRTLAVALGLCVIAFCCLIFWGPYSPALISTDALPGISNLAPPTLVLAFAGLAQMFALALAWPALDARLRSDRVWVVVAVPGSRAMELYLWHMMLFTMAIALAIAVGFAPPVLSPLWWLGHMLALLVVVASAWTLAPVARAAASGLARGLGALAPQWTRLDRLPPAIGLLAAGVAGFVLLLVSESGLGQAATVRTVIAVPYVPLVALLILALTVAIASASRKG